jgi:hypothetical protein
MVLEEFPKLVSQPTQKLMLESLHNATKGDEYRFGHLDPKKDNLYPSYSNPVSRVNFTLKMKYQLIFSRLL